MAAPCIYVTRPLRNGYRRTLEAYGPVAQWTEDCPIPRDRLLEAVRGVSGLLCLGDDRIDRDVIAAGRSLRAISTATAGWDHIDLEAAAAHGIAVCHTPGAAEASVADLTMALLLACARGIVSADRFVRSGAWQCWTPYLFQGIELAQSTLGIVGLGHIGLQVAHRAQGFGMRVLYHDVQRNEDAEERMGLLYGGLENLLRESDFVSLHVPLLPGTRGLIDARRLRLMRPSAFLINLARGGVVDHEALVEALRRGTIAGAALDVHHREPLPADDPILSLPNVILTPHIGANTRKAITRMTRQAAEELVLALRGVRPPHALVWPERGQRAA